MKLNEEQLKDMIQTSLQKAFSKNLTSLGGNDAVTDNFVSLNKMKNMAEEEVEEETGYSPFLKSDENPEGETEGLTVDVLNQILMKIVQDEEGGETTEATGAGSAGGYSAPLFAEPKKNTMFQPGTEGNLTTKPKGGPISEATLKDYEKYELVRKLVKASKGPSAFEDVKKIIDSIERKLDKSRSSGVKYVHGVKVDEQESDDSPEDNQVEPDETDIKYNFFKGEYEPETKSYVGAYLVGEETPKQLEVYNIIEKPDSGAFYMSGHVPYSMSLKKSMLPISQIEVLDDVPGKDGFKFIKMPYWFFKKNQNDLRISRIDKKKSLYLKGMDSKEENMERLFDPMFEKYFDVIVYDDIDQKKYDIAKSNYIRFKKPVNEEEIKGGLADGIGIENIAIMHDVDMDTMFEQLRKGIRIEMEHTTEMMIALEIAMDHLFEDPYYYDKLDDMEGGEATEATTSSSAGVYDAPFGGPKKDPLKLSNPDTVEKELRSVKDKNFPKYGGPGGKFVKIKKKCSKFPYCNQGDINALEFFERDMVKEMVTNTAKRTNVEEYVVRNIIAKELGYIKEQEDGEEHFATFELPDDYKLKSAEENQKEWLDSIPDKKTQFLLKELKDKEFEFNANNGLSGKVKIIDAGPKGKIGGFFGVANDYDFGDSNYAEVWVEMSDLKFKGQSVPVEFYEMISRYLPPEEEEDSYRGNPVEDAIILGMDYVKRVMKSLGLHLISIRINPYARFR